MTGVAQNKSSGKSVGKPYRGKPQHAQPPRSGRRPPPSRQQPPDEPAGLAARRLAVHLIEAVLVDAHSLDAALDSPLTADLFGSLEARDRAFARLITATVLRRLGSLEAVLAAFIERPLPRQAGRARSILLACTAQILLIGTPVHAAINLAVEQCRRDPAARNFDKLANAVLRRVATDGPAVLQGLDWPRTDIPPWLWSRWIAAYGPETAAAIASASLTEADLDLSLAPGENGAAWAERLGGRQLATGTIRLAEHGRVEALAGYADGKWWVQDAAAALPARLVGAGPGQRVADLCAAPGGKSAELAFAGAAVTAVDIAPDRLQRLADNMRRLGLAGRVQPVAADILAWQPADMFDAVLLDAPCTATGTIRRHPDILRLKRAQDVAKLAALQASLLARAVAMLKPGGRLVYCTCSLEPEEGPLQIARLLAGTFGLVREPIQPEEAGCEPAWITPDGDLRTLPHQMPDGPGLDGFYAARLRKPTA